MADRLGNYLLLPHTQTELKCSLMHGKASSLDLNGDAVWLVTDLGQIWAAFKNLSFYYLKLSCPWKVHSGIRKHGLYLVNGSHS